MVPGPGPHIETRDAWVEFPIFDAKSRSLKKAFLGKAGGTIGRNSSNVVVVEALRDMLVYPSVPNLDIAANVFRIIGD